MYPNLYCKEFIIFLNRCIDTLGNINWILFGLNLLKANMLYENVRSSYTVISDVIFLIRFLNL